MPRKKTTSVTGSTEAVREARENNTLTMTEWTAVQAWFKTKQKTLLENSPSVAKVLEDINRDTDVEGGIYIKLEDGEERHLERFKVTATNIRSMLNAGAIKNWNPRSETPMHGIAKVYHDLADLTRQLDNAVRSHERYKADCEIRFGRYDAEIARLASLVTGFQKQLGEHQAVLQTPGTEKINNLRLATPAEKAG